MSSSSSTAPRILMLPGWTQSASIYHGRLAAIRSAIGDKAELVFVDPTHRILMPTLPGASSDPSANPFGPPESLPRAWWFGDFAEGSTAFRGIEATLAYLRRVLETQGPFDAMWGFSQGGACAAILASLIADPSQHPVFAAPGTNWPPPPLKFAIMVSGFIPLDPMCQALFARKIETPCLLVLGKGDTVAGHDRSLELLDGFPNLRVEWHDGGHHTPTKRTWRRFFEAYVTCSELTVESLAAIPGPTGRAYSQIESAKL